MHINSFVSAICLALASTALALPTDTAAAAEVKFCRITSGVQYCFNTAPPAGRCMTFGEIDNSGMPPHSFNVKSPATSCRLYHEANCMGNAGDTIRTDDGHPLTSLEGVAGYPHASFKCPDS